MKAYVLHVINDLRYEVVNKPELKEGWVLVQVKASGICSSDIPRIFKKGTYHFPTIPGHEFSGIVKEVFNENQKQLLGKRVGVFPLIPCKKCSQCLVGNYEMCEHYDYLGSRRDGGFSELVAVPIWNLVMLPDNVSFEQGALLEPVSVAYHAIKRANIKPSDKIAVVGTGMIGFAVAQWAKREGAKQVCIIGRNNKKKKLSGNFAEIQYLMIDEIEKGYSFDKVIEAVGSNITLETSIKIAAPGSRIVLMGNPEGDMTISQDIYWKILRKQTWKSNP